MSRRRCSVLALAVITSLALAACGREAVPLQGAGTSATLSHHNLLPAYALPWEKLRGGKADAAFKNANPQWFEETVAPAGSFRGMKEWEPMKGMLITYDSGLVGDSTVSQTIVDTIKGALQAGKVYVLHDTANAKSTLITKLKNNGVAQANIDAQMEFIQLDLSAFWTIDFGPFPLISADNTQAFLDFRYYPGREEDDAVPSRLGELWGATVYRIPLDDEGGNFQHDGAGTCYTSERELENTGLSQQALNDLLEQYAACQNLVVMKDIWNDGTGHIDMFFKLTDTKKAILGEFTSAQDATAKADMDANEALLEGLGVTVFRMPHPNAYEDPTYGTTPRTYLNSTLFNGTTMVNLWPMYTVDKDIEADALAVWQQALPEWTHIGIVSDDISTLSGAIHCITRTIPDLPFVRWVADGTCGDAGTCTAVEGAYSGTCTSDADCHGPEWLCVADGTCGQTTPDACNGVTYEGCCDGAVVTWCENNEIQTVDCANDPQSPGPACGWSTDGYYWCVDAVSSDPSGDFPRSCGPCEASCTGKVCGDDGCGGSCGTCGAGQACQGGQCVACTADCTGKVCGDDGCGGSCGTCGDTEVCSDAGQCTDPCQGVTFEGCCQGDTVVWCENNELASVSCPDAVDAGQADGPKCGWLASEGYYWCDSTGAAEPTGQYPQACDTTCTPSCGGKQCGDDGCGGSCGTCAAGQACDAGQCVGEPTCTNECTEGQVGCVDAATPFTCAQGSDGCWDKVPVACGTNQTCDDGVCVDLTCTPDCGGKVCGDDGCGGSCGACAAGEQCTDGLCAKVPTGDVTDDTATGDTIVPGTDTDGDDASSGGGGNRGGDGGGSCSLVAVGGSGASLAPALLGLVSLLGLAARRRRA
jgi:agmatine/peptidylarginine deiminase